MGAVLLSLIGAFVFLFTGARRHDARLIPYAGAALAMHVGGAFAQLWITESYYGVGDVFTYAESGKLIAKALDLDFARFAPEVLKLALHLRADLVVTHYETGDSTTTMMALTGFLIYFVGDSLIASFLVVSTIAWGGQTLLAMTVGSIVDEDERPTAYAATLLVPSVIFWSSSIVKEGFVLAGLGLLCFSAHRVLVERRIYLAPGIVVGALTIAMIKPYVLFPFFLGIGGWILATRARGGRMVFRPASIIIGGLVAVGGVLLMSRAFPEFGLEKLGEHTAAQQQAWTDSDNSSNVDVGAGANASLASQIPYVPIALVNTLFRPFIFETRNLTTFVAALETTTLIVLVGQTLAKGKLARIGSVTVASPLLLGSAVFVLFFSVAVGLATKNLGSLSRYRMPMIPFYVLLILLLRSRLRRATEDEPSAAEDEAGDEA